MPASIREQIMLQIETLLGAGTPPAGLVVHRERTRPIEKESLPAILLRCEDDDPKPLAGQLYKAPLTERQLVVHAECRALGSSSTPPDAALDPIIVWATQTILQNESFIGLANGVVEGKTSWHSAEGDVALAAATVIFTVKYRTSRLDPTSKS